MNNDNKKYYGSDSNKHYNDYDNAIGSYDNQAALINIEGETYSTIFHHPGKYDESLDLDLKKDAFNTYDGTSMDSFNLGIHDSNKKDSPFYYQTKHESGDALISINNQMEDFKKSNYYDGYTGILWQANHKLESNYPF